MSSRLDIIKDNRFLWTIMGIGLLARFFVLVFLSNQVNQTDVATYLRAADDILAGRLFSSELVMPLYPLQAALMGGSALALKISDIGLSTLSIWLIHGIALEMFKDRAAALIAALAAAVYPFFLFYAAAGLTETSYTFLVLLGIYLLYKGRLVWGAGVLVLSILSRPTFEPLLPLLLLVFASVVHRLPWRAAGLLVVKAVLIYGVLMTPWWVHNYAKYDQFVRLSLGDGRMLYMGNNPMNQSGGGRERIDADMSRFYADYKDPLARNTAMKTAAFAYIRSHPGHFLKMAAVKFKRFWRLWPYAPEYNSWIYIFVSLASYGVALVLAGMFLMYRGRGHWRILTPVILMAGFLSAVHMVTLASIRYRFPLEPFVLVLAAQMAVDLLQRWKMTQPVLPWLRGERT